MGCVTVFAVLCGGFVFTLVMGVTQFIKSAEPYQDSLAQIQQSAEMQRLLGEPIQDGTFVSGQLSINNDSGEADFQYSVSGPIGSASVHVVATKSEGKWTYSTLDVTPDDGEPRSLLPRESAP